MNHHYGWCPEIYKMFPCRLHYNAIILIKKSLQREQINLNLIHFFKVPDELSEETAHAIGYCSSASRHDLMMTDFSEEDFRFIFRVLFQ